VSAFHPASRMLSVNKVRRSSVKGFVSVLYVTGRPGLCFFLIAVWRISISIRSRAIVLVEKQKQGRNCRN
jgi:hypothetical protein